MAEDMLRLRIARLWAFIAVDEDGDEGICAFLATSGGTHFPMVAADPARVESLKPIARRPAAAVPGKRIELRRFGGTYEVEEVFGG